MPKETPPLYFEMHWNFNLQASSIGLEEESDVVEKGYKPLISLHLDKHPDVKVDAAFVGYTNLRLAERHSDFIEMVKEGVKKGQFNLVHSVGYAHSMVSLIPYEDVKRQLEKGLEIHEKTWGSRPNGYHSPEGQWDASLPKILNEVGIKWAETGDIIYRESPFLQYVSREDLYRPVYAAGIEGAKIPVVFSSRSEIKPLYLKILRGESLRFNIRSFIRELDEIQKLNRDGDLIVNVGMDPELMHYMDPDRGKALDEFMTAIEDVPYLRFTTFEEYLKTHKPKRTVYLKCTPSSGAGMAFDVWKKGSEKLDALCNRAREEIYNAESVILLAEKLGADVTKSKKLLEQAWDYLLLSEDSDARSAASVFRREFFMFNMGAYFPGAASRMIAAYENALKACELARASVKAIEVKGKRS